MMRLVPVIAMEGSRFLRFLVVFLYFSHLFFLNVAVPVSRTRSLMHESQAYRSPEKTQLGSAEESLELVGEEMNARRVEVELNDYPGSGANNRHTPRRGCADC
ncbi:uncharacterized protein LOC127793075 [Diospyros lotus]|uniref:uncharacterized protein LOC127793075 n=1 Tax=Diospyros lotus TaxID=55363 RepID=UPI0022558DF4|nr:uncharacterized protein LOC127793075 [Diospyros lotus]